jgi:dipeptidyl-peptidase-4
MKIKYHPAKSYAITLITILISFITFSQNKISLEDIWIKYTFRPASPPQFTFTKQGNFYITENEQKDIIKKELVSGKTTQTLVTYTDVQKQNSELKLEDYELSDNEKYLIIYTQRELIYRHSSKATTYLWDIQKKQLIPLSNGEKIMFPKLSPDETKIAYIKNNNIYITDLNTLQEKAVTTDGKWNVIKNGWADWVYEEEFGKPDFIAWSCKGNYLAYLKFNEEKVKEFSLNFYNGNVYPEKYSFKYPKAGEDNSEVNCYVYDVTKSENIQVPTPTNFQEIYIPRILWLNQSEKLCITLLNRHQNHLQLFLFDPNQKTFEKFFEEKSDTYIEINDALKFINNDQQFFWLSNNNGYQHIYLYNIKGQLIQAITQGNFDVENILAIDEKEKEIYFTSTENSVINRPVYKIKLNGKDKKLVSPPEGSNSIQFSPDFKYYILSHHTANEPPVYTLHSKDGKLLQTLEDNYSLKIKMQQYDFTKKEFYSFQTSNGIELHYWIMKPKNFDPTKKYPVFVTAYNGPGINKVNNAFEYEYFFHQFLCQQGYIVACADGRGTFGKGKAFMHCTYLQLGKLETQDQIEFVKYLKKQPFVDGSKIAFQGWSYGGFMALNMITKGADEIKAAISIAPVSNWKFYDNIYTERYMRLPKENPFGYNELSPINFIDKMKGKLLLIHGEADDNVHIQNAMEFVRVCVEKNKPLEYFVYPNKNHSIYGGYTRFHLYSKMFNFLETNLK